MQRCRQKVEKKPRLLLPLQQRFAFGASARLLVELMKYMYGKEEKRARCKGSSAAIVVV